MANPAQALPTQKFIEVKAVTNGALILKGGGLRQIVLVSGLNFDLKSTEEQEAITFAYQSFLNSLNFTIQIFIHSRKLNIEGYLESISKLSAKETNPLLKNQINEYHEFVGSFVRENAIMNKTFFVVVPFDSIQTGASEETTKKALGFFGKKPTTQTPGETDSEARLQRELSQLAQRTEQVIGGLNQLGLRAVALNDTETTELLYNLYNPEATEKRGAVVLEQPPK